MNKPTLTHDQAERIMALALDAIATAAALSRADGADYRALLNTDRATFGALCSHVHGLAS
jgi:hypothetical protein